MKKVSKKHVDNKNKVTKAVPTKDKAVNLSAQEYLRQAVNTMRSKKSVISLND